MEGDMPPMPIRHLTRELYRGILRLVKAPRELGRITGTKRRSTEYVLEKRLGARLCPGRIIASRRLCRFHPEGRRMFYFKAPERVQTKVHWQLEPKMRN